MDTYGGFARHGGGAFSGKDPTKVDRSAAYAARWVAKNLVAAGLTDRLEIQVSYAIGVAHPIAVSVETFGSNKVPDDVIVRLIDRHFESQARRDHPRPGPADPDIQADGRLRPLRAGRPGPAVGAHRQGRRPPARSVRPPGGPGPGRELAPRTHRRMVIDSARWLERLVFREVDRDTWGDLGAAVRVARSPQVLLVHGVAPDAERRPVRQCGEEGRPAPPGGGGRTGRHTRYYVDGEPVAWCSIAPRETYRGLGGVSQATTGCALMSGPADGQDRVWSLVCFFVPRRLRGHGVTRRAIEAALDHAGRHGATVVEAYPVEPDSPSYRFHGAHRLFRGGRVHRGGQGRLPPSRHAPAPPAVTPTTATSTWTCREVAVNGQTAYLVRGGRVEGCEFGQMRYDGSEH